MANTTFRHGHIAVLSPDDDAPGGHRLRCTVADCDLDRTGSEAFLVGLSMDHYEATLEVAHV